MTKLYFRKLIDSTDCVPRFLRPTHIDCLRRLVSRKADAKNLLFYPYAGFVYEGRLNPIDV